MGFRGLYTAIVTPFTSDGDLDLAAFGRLIDLQLAAGVDGIVVTGSTGEGATTTTAEKEQLWSFAVERVNGRIPIIAGTGTNDTRGTVDLTARAAACGVQGALVVTPYYNKPTPDGQIAHYRAVADSTSLPVILYNVPGRTGTNMTPATQLAIARACPNVVATKEASANIEQMCEIMRDAPDHFCVLAGDDSLALPIIACGGVGVIAVISNYAPKRYGRLIHAALRGDLDTARAEQYRLMPFYSANFFESNPIPVKWIMHMLGHMQPTYRLPLVPPTQTTQQRLHDVFRDFVDA
ncbi:MAG: 4-hydroxy-tetrahydrodipicolinate synthase [Candidatus Kapabacteria bacterium]|nr:4-hydroxy-tetrahydrodipicolinate synthase [Candidatus Kapabacteria bacterium]